MKYLPYTYYLFHRPTKTHYYGRKTSNRQRHIANPAELWTKYFTSSKIVHQLIETYGANSFDVEVRKTFATAEQAISWETRVLQRLKARERSEWLNQTNGDDDFANATAWNKGRKHSDETKAKMAKAHKDGRNGISNIRKANPDKFPPTAWEIQTPTGVERVENLTQFCKDHNLSRSALRYFEGRNYRGYVLTRIPL